MNLIRNLIGLIITITMLPLCALAFRYTSDIKFDYNEVSDEIALCQLREDLLISYDMNISNKELNFKYKNKDYKLSLINSKLILQPGTQIFLNDIDNLYFMCKNNCIYVCYERGNNYYERIISSQEGFYIDNFSSCDVLSDDDHCE